MSHELLNQQHALQQRSDALFVGEYLLNHPEFFMQQPELLLKLRLPHGEQGTVSLVERQLTLLRQQVQTHERHMAMLIENAKKNEQIFRFNCQLTPLILTSQSMEDLQETLATALQQEYGFAEVKLLVVHDFDQQLQQIYQQRLNATDYFGQISEQESQCLFNRVVGSVALTRLDIGFAHYILAIASDNADHFVPQMDSMLHQQMTQMLRYQMTKL